MQGTVKNLDNEVIYVQAVFPSLGDSVYYDTLQLENGVFRWNVDLGAPAEVQMTVSRDRKIQRGRWVVPETQKIGFFVMPGEKVRLSAYYDSSFLEYELKGSGNLAVQSSFRRNIRSHIEDLRHVEECIAAELAEGVENANEAAVDSFYELYDRLVKCMKKQNLDYVSRHPGSELSAYLLLNYPDRDTFLYYYEGLDESVREGIWKDRLDKAEESARRMVLIRENAQKLSAGNVAPDFVLSDVDGNPVRLSDFADRYVVLDFWGTWCPWCVKGIPQMKQYWEKCRSKTAFIGIACRDKSEKVKEMVGREGIGWTNLMNGTDVNDISVLYGVSGYPTKIILAPGLVVMDRYLGETSEFYETLDTIMSR